MDRLDMLRTFVAVADHASFAEAARRLRVSPTAASRAVAALEQALGTELLRRTTRSVRLTDEGATEVALPDDTGDEQPPAAPAGEGETE